MFTGIVEELGRVARLERLAGAARLTVQASAALLTGARRGDSYAVNGVCLTLTDLVDGDPAELSFDVIAETLGRSSLGALRAGDPVNLERPLPLGGRLGGHLVQGHVDAVATVLARTADTYGERVELSVPPALSRYIVTKGSITVDGVSLTVVEAGEDCFAVSLIPETLARTTLGQAAVGSRVNLEVDVIGKYVERLLAFRADGSTA